VALFGGNLFEMGQMLYGMERYLAELACIPRLRPALGSAHRSTWAKLGEKWLGAVGPHVDVVLSATTSRPDGPPHLSGDLPPHLSHPSTGRCAAGQGAGGSQGAAHSAGGIEPLLGDFVEMGLDAVNPVQTSARAWRGALKARYGDRLCFWGGGCDTHQVLPAGTPPSGRPRAAAGGVMARGSASSSSRSTTSWPTCPRRTWWAMIRAAAELRGDA